MMNIHPIAATTLATLAAVGLVSTSCGFPLGSCEQERIEVRGTTTVERAGQTSTDEVFAVFAPGNNPQQYPAVKRFLIDAAPQAGDAVVWTVPAFRINGGHIAVELSGPLRVGDRVPVVGSFEGGGWGASTTSSDAAATVGVRADNFIASSASGTIEVLAVAPLRLRLEVSARNAAGTTMGIGGELRFSLVREKGACT
jgi:hypothetical protein